MHQSQTSEPMPDAFAMAKLAYTRWEREQAQQQAEDERRRRTIELAAIVRAVIDEELTARERAVIRMTFFDELKPDEIAARLGLSRSTVAHTICRGENRLRRFLRYVVQYQCDAKDVPFLPFAVRRAAVVCAAQERRADTLPDRLRKLRAQADLSPQDVAEAVGIGADRLNRLERGAALPDAAELLRLCAFYGVSADALLKGDEKCSH